MFDIYLGIRQAAVRPAGQPVQWTSLELGRDPWSQVGDLLKKAELDAKRRWMRAPVRIWLSGAFARPFLFGPIPGLTKWSEAVRVAESMATDQTGLSGSGEIWLSHWRPGAACVAVAGDKECLDRVHDLAKERHLRIRSIRPWWGAAQARAADAAPSPSLIVVEDTDSLTVLASTEDEWAAASTTVPLPDIAQSQAMTKRAISSHSGGTDGALKVRLIRRDLEHSSSFPEAIEVGGIAATWEWAK